MKYRKKFGLSIYGGTDQRRKVNALWCTGHEDQGGYMFPRYMTFKRRMLVLCCSTLLFMACGGEEEAYSDENDFTTTALETNIVQIITGSSSPDWVEVYLSVTDQDGSPLENFTIGNFEIVEFVTDSQSIDGGEITLDVVGQSGAPIVTPMTMDYSGSMSSTDIADMENAVKTFVENMQSMDRAEIIKFSNYVEVVQGLTVDKNLLNAAIDSSWPGAGGTTALYDAMYQGVTDACPENGLRAVVAFTDGWENASVHTMSDVIAKADSCQFGIYTIGLGSDIDSIGLKTIADTTGGRYFHAPTSQELDDLYNMISGQLKKTYILRWEIQSASGSIVECIIKTTYTCGNGTFEYISVGTFVSP